MSSHNIKTSDFVSIFCSRPLEIEEMAKLDPHECRRGFSISRFKEENPSETKERIQILYENVQSKFNEMLMTGNNLTKEQKFFYAQNLIKLGSKIDPNPQEPLAEFPIIEGSFKVTFEQTPDEIMNEFEEIDGNDSKNREKRASIFCQAAKNQLSTAEKKMYTPAVPFAFIEALQASQPDKNIYFVRYEQHRHATLQESMMTLKHELREKPEGLIFIPIGLIGQGVQGLLNGACYEGHAILITIKFSDNWKTVTMEYYDPKGREISDADRCQDTGEPLTKLLNQTRAIFCTNSGWPAEFFSSSRQDQQLLNTTDCVLHVTHHIKRHAQGDMKLTEKIDDTRIETLDFIDRHLKASSSC